MALYITKLNLDGTQYSAINTINKLDLDGVVYDIGLNTSDANAVSSDIKQGKTAYVNGQKITGSLAPYGPQTITPTTQNQSFGPGVYLNGQITVLGSTALIPGNIKSGVNIFGVVGTHVSLANYRVISTYSGHWMGSNSFCTWMFANKDGTCSTGNANLDRSNSWTSDFDGTVRVTLAGHNKCYVNSISKTGTFTINNGDIIYWWGNQGNSYLVQTN